MASEAPLVRMFCIISQLTVWLHFVFMAHLMTNSTSWFQASLLDPWFGSSVALALNLLCCGAVFSSEKPSMQLESTVLHQSIQIHLFYISNSVVLRKVWPQHQINYSGICRKGLLSGRCAVTKSAFFKSCIWNVSAVINNEATQFERKALHLLRDSN